ncbi:hypothetical protein B5P46_11905 [Rhizobium leguminosarum]|uniref:Uncharacterized protein n=1 Tax=Rhizobium leguminosarum TaxID=384 RepID=A0A4Q1UEU7_RHILE|nr:hypothetical protein [Rhizobium leguminosarum]RXT29378.1 hypothetical protein B5P46_11905 [Rhizobium leguminosarum]
MSAVLIAFLRKNWAAVAIAAAAVVALLWIVQAAYSRGAADAKSEAREAVFNQLKERNATDAEIENMPAAELCRAIGGELRNDRCE